MTYTVVMRLKPNKKVKEKPSSPKMFAGRRQKFRIFVEIISDVFIAKSIRTISVIIVQIMISPPVINA
jgi:hypothetical protein